MMSYHKNFQQQDKTPKENAFATNMSGDIRLAKTKLSKVIQSGE